MVSKGQFVGLDWNRITRLHSSPQINIMLLLFHLQYTLPKLTGIFGLESSQHFTVGQKLDISPETEQNIFPHIIFDFLFRE